MDKGLVICDRHNECGVSESECAHKTPHVHSMLCADCSCKWNETVYGDSECVPVSRSDTHTTPDFKGPIVGFGDAVIKSPSHYAARGGIEPIDFITSNGLDFLEGSVVKYVYRYPHKNGLEDLCKARQYIDLLIAREESKT